MLGDYILLNVVKCADNIITSSIEDSRLVWCLYRCQKPCHLAQHLDAQLLLDIRFINKFHGLVLNYKI